jgi:hypothetical protein
MRSFTFVLLALAAATHAITVRDKNCCGCIPPKCTPRDSILYAKAIAAGEEWPVQPNVWVCLTCICSFADEFAVNLGGPARILNYAYFSARSHYKGCIIKIVR